MDTLRLPDHGVKTKQDADGPRVWCPARRRWVALTPEEWVRQHFLNHLVHDLGCPLSLVAVEQGLSLHGLSKRADIVVYGRDGAPVALVECKAPGVKLTQGVFDQAARYNIHFRVRWLLVTNGLLHYACEVAHAEGKVRFAKELPGYGGMANDGPV
ncbi:MAG: type I restriction enzyme HsdR N-terminal domain-containing protein [Flavobacteriales bacterium]|nr:type I restriction enzyme HsdR N-terminal domain-containing protein [Flavobacteriales bacterium]